MTRKGSSRPKSASSSRAISFSCCFCFSFSSSFIFSISSTCTPCSARRTASAAVSCSGVNWAPSASEAATPSDDAKPVVLAASTSMWAAASSAPGVCAMNKCRRSFFSSSVAVKPFGCWTSDAKCKFSGSRKAFTHMLSQCGCKLPGFRSSSKDGVAPPPAGVGEPREAARTSGAIAGAGGGGRSLSPAAPPIDCARDRPGVNPGADSVPPSAAPPPMPGGCRGMPVPMGCSALRSCPYLDSTKASNVASLSAAVTSTLRWESAPASTMASSAASSIKSAAYPNAYVVWSSISASTSIFLSSFSRRRLVVPAAPASRSRRSASGCATSPAFSSSGLAEFSRSTKAGLRHVYERFCSTSATCCSCSARMELETRKARMAAGMPKSPGMRPSSKAGVTPCTSSTTSGVRATVSVCPLPSPRMRQQPWA